MTHFLCYSAVIVSTCSPIYIKIVRDQHLAKGGTQRLWKRLIGPGAHPMDVRTPIGFSLRYFREPYNQEEPMMMNEHDRLIERYMAGDMDIQEQHEFLARASTDPELASLLNAERAIISGTRKDRNRMPRASTRPKTRLLAKLAATQVPPSPAWRGIVSGTGGFGNSTVQAALAAVAMLGIIIGAFIIAPLMHPDAEIQEQPPQHATPSSSEKTRAGGIQKPPSGAPATTKDSV